MSENPSARLDGKHSSLQLCLHSPGRSRSFSLDRRPSHYHVWPQDGCTHVCPTTPPSIVAQFSPWTQLQHSFFHVGIPFATYNTLLLLRLCSSAPLFTEHLYSGLTPLQPHCHSTSNTGAQWIQDFVPQPCLMFATASSCGPLHRHLTSFSLWLPRDARCPTLQSLRPGWSLAGRNLLSGLIFLQKLIVGSHFPPETYLRILTSGVQYIVFHCVGGCDGLPLPSFYLQ